MKIRFLSLALLAILIWPSSGLAQQFISVPGGTSVTDITPDGSIVVGYGTGGAFYWRWQVDPAPIFIGGLTAVAVSDDGSVITGNIKDPVLNDTVAGRWTAATGWVSLGYLPNAGSCPGRSSARDISGDGSTVVGLSWEGCNARGFRWTAATGMQELQVLANGGNNALAISGDGSVMGGYARNSVSRTPAFWAADTSGFTPDVNSLGEVNGLTTDGSLSVGLAIFGSANFYTAFMRTSSGTMTDLGALDPANMAATATDVSEDGKTIVGYDFFGLTQKAWVWKSNDGIISLNDRLSAVGVSNVPPIYGCNAVSDDGKVVVGNHGGPGIFSAGYIAVLSPKNWVNLGGGTQGINGIPILQGSGTLVGGTPAGLKLLQAPLFTLTVAWVSFASTPLPVFGGTLYAFPHNLQYLFITQNGEATVNTTWPVGVPPGTDIWFQFLLSDPSVVWDITLSNALEATTP